jgi:hypothetical protein
VTGDQAGEVALDHIRTEWRPNWEPVVVKVEDAGPSWRVFYNNRAYVETGAISHALGGNRPLLIDKITGIATVDATY